MRAVQWHDLTKLETGEIVAERRLSLRPGGLSLLGCFGQHLCLTAFFAVWTVHHDCDRYHFIARTVRSRMKNMVTLSMFFHVEHHLFPRVPTRRLNVVAQRLDAAAPELSRMRVF